MRGLEAARTGMATDCRSGQQHGRDGNHCRHGDDEEQRSQSLPMLNVRRCTCAARTTTARLRRRQSALFRVCTVRRRPDRFCRVAALRRAIALATRETSADGTLGRFRCHGPSGRGWLLLGEDAVVRDRDRAPGERARHGIAGSMDALPGGRGGWSTSSSPREGAMSSAVQLLDAAGRRRSPATLPDFHAGRAPGDKGQR